jgi:esterase/lipase superfamily enzyme
MVRAAALLLALALASCGGRPAGIMQGDDTAASPPGATTVEMIVATTRAPSAAAGEMFSGERAVGLAFADIAVSIPPSAARKVGEVQWPSRLPANPATDFVTRRARTLDMGQAKALFRAKIAATRRGHALIFVHGYNTRFEEAVYRFAQIAHDSGAQATPVLFTWPSRGRLLAYNYDRESASYSRDALEAMLQAMQASPDVREISILAHSMGNWVTLEALRQMAIRDKRIAPKIRNVMLAAPDVDFDVFRRQIALMGAPRPHFTLFVSQDDDALAVSARLGGGEARLGMIDPKAEPYRTTLEKARIEPVDLTDISSPDRIRHGKFAEAPEVVRSIGLRLAAGQALNDGQAGVGEKLGQVAVGAASAAGRAASVVVSAPIAVVDGRTREGLGDQIGELGADLGGTMRAAAGVAKAR